MDTEISKVDALFEKAEYLLEKVEKEGKFIPECKEAFLEV